MPHERTIAGIIEAAALEAGAAVAGLPVEHARLTAIGWATVELDRAAAELAADLDLAADPFLAAAGSRALGASCRVAAAVLPGGTAIVLLEPDTEGRLAATLARFGEGPVAAWYATDAIDAPGTWAPSSGPFGPERLVAGDPVHGPHRFLIAAGPGTIRS